MAIFDHSVITLATLAGCGQPDSPNSPGAKFLVGVVDAVEDAIDNDEDDEGTLNEIAEDAPAVSTHEKWQQFVDLRGYRVDTTDQYGDRISARGISDYANSVLVVIADNLIRALVEEHDNDTIDKPKLAALMAESSPWEEEK